MIEILPEMSVSWPGIRDLTNKVNEIIGVLNAAERNGGPDAPAHRNTNLCGMVFQGLPCQRDVAHLGKHQNVAHDVIWGDEASFEKEPGVTKS